VADLIRRQIAVIVGHGQPALIAKAATTTTPIVFVVGDDPVKVGLVANLNRPGGNVTGVTFLATDATTKRLGLLLELVPRQPSSPCCWIRTFRNQWELRSVEAAGKTLGRRVLVGRLQRA
jgi:putative ABC transport system substrate-binding protein